jgi:hypothetical protein
MGTNTELLHESVPHTICNECTLRIPSNVIKRKRMIKCPKCLTVETKQGIRSTDSHNKNIMLYASY